MIAIGLSVLAAVLLASLLSFGFGMGTTGGLMMGGGMMGPWSHGGWMPWSHGGWMPWSHVR